MEGFKLTLKNINGYNTIWQSVCIMALCSTFTFAQNTWTQTYGDSLREFANDVIETSDQGYLIQGAVDELYADYPWLIKTNQNGDIEWTKTYDGFWDHLYAVIETSDQAFLSVGATYQGGQPEFRDVWLVKTSLSGEFLWQKDYGGPYGETGKSVIETSDQNLLIVGYTGSYTMNNDYDSWLIKADMNGDTLWTKTYGGLGNDLGISVIETSEQDYLMLGYTNSYGNGNNDFWLVKTDMNGDTLWSKTYGGAGNDMGYSVIETSEQDYLLFGITYSYGNGPNDFWLIKTDENGDALWNRTYGGTSGDSPGSVIETSDHSYLMAGANNDGVLVKTDTNGYEIWTRTYGYSWYDGAKSVIETSDNAYLFAGHTYASGNSDIWLVKTDSLGNTTSTVSVKNKLELPFSHSVLVSPNPMNNACSITYSISGRSQVYIDIYNIKGTRVWSHVFGEQIGGTYKHFWNTRDHNGDNLGSGIYILQVSTTSWRESTKLILLK